MAARREGALLCCRGPETHGRGGADRFHFPGRSTPGALRAPFFPARNSLHRIGRRSAFSRQHSSRGGQLFTGDGGPELDGGAEEEMTRLALGALAFALTLTAASERPPAPAISLPDTDGRTVTLDEYRGRLVLLAFTRGAW